MIDKLKKIGLVALMAFPLWIPAAGIAATVILSPPSKLVQYQDRNYRIEKDEKETRLYYGDLVTMTELTDKNNDGSIDKKFSRFCVPRRGCLGGYPDITEDDKKLYAAIIDIMKPESATHYYTKP
jgi:hypothetical protein